MKKIFLLFLLITFYSSSSFAINKKEALYQDGSSLHHWSYTAGQWVAWMKSCMGHRKFAQQIKEEVANLSWPDFKTLGNGESAFESAYVAARSVDSEVKKGMEYLRNYTRELSGLVKTKTNKSLNSKPEKKKNTVIYCQKSTGDVYTTIHNTCVPDKKIRKELYLEIKKEKRTKKVKKEEIKPEKGGIEEKLKKLKSLYEGNLITKEEYDSKRNEILDSY